MNAPASFKPRARRLRAFTLMELVIVVIIIALISTMALQRVVVMRSRAQYAATAASVRAFADAFHMYYAINLALPPDRTGGVFPPEMTQLISMKDWTRGPAIGGAWDWNGIDKSPWSGLKQNNISIRQSPQPTALWLDFDRAYDDNSLSTGTYQALNGGVNYCCPVDP